MFDTLKQINQIRAMQQQLKQQRVEVEQQGIKVAMRGDFQIESIQLNPALDIRAQEKALIACINDAKDKIQTLLAKDFAGKLF